MADQTNFGSALPFKYIARLEDGHSVDEKLVLAMHLSRFRSAMQVLLTAFSLGDPAKI